jgi:hypothetical protein
MNTTRPHPKSLKISAKRKKRAPWSGMKTTPVGFGTHLLRNGYQIQIFKDNVYSKFYQHLYIE